MTDKPHTPTTLEIRKEFINLDGTFANGAWDVGSLKRFDRWYQDEIATAEQRGAEQAFRKTQEIIAGFEHTIDEARNRDDMINTGYLIQKIDTEIQDLMEGDDA